MKKNEENKHEWIEGKMILRFFTPVEYVYLKKEKFNAIIIDVKDMLAIKALIDEFFKEYPMGAEE